jgi:hypothetical protein
MPSPDLDAELDLDLPDGMHSRIQTLLVSVRDIASSLYRLSVQLEREIGPVLAAGPDELSGQRVTEAAELQRLRTEVDQLRGSLDARVMIEQAKGMVMAVHGCSDQQAFELLVGMSQAEQRKVRDIAADLVARSGRAASTATTSTEAPGRPTPGPARPGLRIDLDSPGQQLPVGRQLGHGR